MTRAHSIDDVRKIVKLKDGILLSTEYKNNISLIVVPYEYDCYDKELLFKFIDKELANYGL